MEATDLVTSKEAGLRLGVSQHTLRQVIRRENVPVFQHPLNARVRLIRTADLEALRTPRRLTGNTTAAGVAA